jgi:hypothetical protein
MLYKIHPVPNTLTRLGYEENIKVDAREMGFEMWNWLGLEG